MQVRAAVLSVLFSLRSVEQYGAAATTPHFRAKSGESEEEKDPLRKLQATAGGNHVTMTSPLNSDNMPNWILDPEPSERECYNSVLGSSVPVPQVLVMFDERFVEHKGKVYAAFAKWDDRVNEGGLYEVLESSRDGYYLPCVEYNLLFQSDNIGQIVASAHFDPIEIIGVDTSTTRNRIYGYYPENGVWKRKMTQWGDVQDGTLSVEPQMEGEKAQVIGLSSNMRMFKLWGDFNYSKKDHIECAWGTSGTTKPAQIGEWKGPYARYRGVYCPSVGNSQLKKYTWHGESEKITTDLEWEPAERIGRLSPSSNIVGVSTNGNLLVLWDNEGTIQSAPLHLPDLTKVGSVGGMDDGYAVGFFASNQDGRAYNVYWDGEPFWKVKEMYSWHEGGDFVKFGNYNGHTYMLTGNYCYSSCVCDSDFGLYRFDFVDGAERHNVVEISTGSMDRRRLKERKLCL